MIHEGLFGRHDDLESFLRAYYDIVSCDLFEGTERLYAMAKESAHELQPTFDFGFDKAPTAYELFSLIQGMKPTGPPEPFLDVRGFDTSLDPGDVKWDQPEDMEAFDPDETFFTVWDPSAPLGETHEKIATKFSAWNPDKPIDDTDQYPSDDFTCLPSSL